MANPPLRDQFADAFPDFGPAGTRIDQQGARSSKEKIEKRLLVIRAAGLADDVKILVVSMDVEFRHSRTASCAGGPTIRQHARAKTQIGWWDFGNCCGTSAQQYAYGSETNQQATDQLVVFHGEDAFQSYWIDLRAITAVTEMPARHTAVARFRIVDPAKSVRLANCEDGQ